MMIKKYICLFAIMLCAISLQAKDITEDEALAPATVSFKVVNLNSGEVVAERNSSLCATPASITKVITTATALELLGGDFRFTTLIETNGYIEDGVLHGDLIIHGDADPTLGSGFMGEMDFISRWTNKLQQQGIKHITGNIVADATCIDRCAIPIGWVWEDTGFHYGAGAFGISAYDNFCNIILKSGEPGTKPEVINIFPEQPGIIIKNEIDVLNIAKDSIHVISMPYESRKILQGGMPSNRNSYAVRSTASNPPLQVATRLYNHLKNKEITVDGEAIVQEKYKEEERTTLITYKSPQLREIIKLTNFKSNNMYAEHIFRRLGNFAMQYQATSNASINVVKRFWRRKGIDVSTLHLYDGCGLAPHNAYSADFLTSVLQYMRNSKNWDDFYNSLPTAGAEGTVAAFLRNTPLEKNVRVKSGSLSRVQAYSGYITAKDGEEYAFTIMINNYKCSRREVRAIITKWLNEAVL